MAEQQVQVLSDLGSGWLQCRSAQGIFFHNQATKQSQFNNPFASMPQPQYQTAVVQTGYATQPQVVTYGAPQQQTVTYGAPQQQAVTYGAPPQQAAVEKLRLGNWIICEDAQGEFYHNALTGQSYDDAPPELLALHLSYTQQQQQQQQQPMQYAAPSAAQPYAVYTQPTQATYGTVVQAGVYQQQR
eukprot:NODE_18999_length_864_cov_14.001357.p1 GENE.NODE_18999_length_864_cov_14.001357~~NODE_18999_length_864_cov_14.001357.p1  ORF type:complete len:186 (-),score=46.01 NODE_18999_length_864_cov_14.001357:199-756(-)